MKNRNMYNDVWYRIACCLKLLGNQSGLLPYQIKRRARVKSKHSRESRELTLFSSSSYVSVL